MHTLLRRVAPFFWMVLCTTCLTPLAHADTPVIAHKAAFGLDRLIYLQDVVPASLQEATHWLDTGYKHKAAELFSKALSTPDLFQLAVVGLARSLTYDQRQARLEKLENQSPQTDNTKFERGVLWLYQGPTQRDANQRLVYEQYDKGYALLVDLWTRKHSWVTGMLLADSSMEYHAGWQPISPTKILESLLLQLGGAGQYHMYDNAKKSSWQVDSPQGYSVPVANRHPFTAVLEALKILHSVTNSHGVLTAAGTWEMVPYPEDPLDPPARKFLLGWMNNMKALDAQHASTNAAQSTGGTQH